jgi:hypothetical protein
MRIRTASGQAGNALLHTLARAPCVAAAAVTVSSVAASAAAVPAAAHSCRNTCLLPPWRPVLLTTGAARTLHTSRFSAMNAGNDTAAVASATSESAPAAGTSHPSAFSSSSSPNGLSALRSPFLRERLRKLGIRAPTDIQTQVRGASARASRNTVGAIARSPRSRCTVYGAQPLRCGSLLMVCSV